MTFQKQYHEIQTFMKSHPENKTTSEQNIKVLETKINLVTKEESSCTSTYESVTAQIEDLSKPNNLCLHPKKDKVAVKKAKKKLGKIRGKIRNVKAKLNKLRAKKAKAKAKNIKKPTPKLKKKLAKLTPKIKKAKKKLAALKLAKKKLKRKIGAIMLKPVPKIVPLSKRKFVKPIFTCKLNAIQELKLKKALKKRTGIDKICTTLENNYNKLRKDCLVTNNRSCSLRLSSLMKKLNTDCYEKLKEVESQITQLKSPSLMCARPKPQQKKAKRLGKKLKNLKAKAKKLKKKLRKIKKALPKLKKKLVAAPPKLRPKLKKKLQKKKKAIRKLKGKLAKLKPLKRKIKAKLRQLKKLPKNAKIIPPTPKKLKKLKKKEKKLKKKKLAVRAKLQPLRRKRAKLRRKLAKKRKALLPLKKALRKKQKKLNKLKKPTPKSVHFMKKIFKCTLVPPPPEISGPLNGKGKSREQNLKELISKEKEQLKSIEKDAQTLSNLIRYHEDLVKNGTSPQGFTP